MDEDAGSVPDKIGADVDLLLSFLMSDCTLQ